jgi:hypothetical protein
MPKVVVYVPAKLWRELQEHGIDPASRARELVREGLSGRGRTNAALGSREPVAGTRIPAPRSESPDDHFKPDPK